MKIDLNKVVTVDAETFYSTDYSLSKPAYNTSSYVRDPQFKEHCWAIKVGKKPSKCYPAAKGIELLKAIDWNTHYLLAHNVSFDGFILAHHHGIIPHFYLDTLSMTRGLHADVSRAKLDTIAKLYGLGSKHEGALENTKGKRNLSKDELTRLMSYCNNDNELCFAVFCKQIEIYPSDELRLIDLTVRMFCDSKLHVDLPRARLALAEEMLERRATILRSKVSEEVLQSNPKFADQLRKYGVEPPIKVSLKTGHEAYAFAQTDPEFLELLDHEDIRVVRLAEARLAAKSTQMETRAARLIQAGESGVLPAGYNYYAAKTGRWGGSNKLNLQNLPRVDKKNPRPSDGLRRSIIAPPGHVLVVADSAQIEARTLAWLAGQDDVVKAFAEKRDVYKQDAAGIYNVPVDLVSDSQRFLGKVVRLMLGYGAGPPKFRTMLALGLVGPPMDISAAEASRVVKLYRSRNARIVMAWKEADLVLRRMLSGSSGEAFNGVIEFDPHTIWLPNGMGIHYPGLHVSEHEAIKYSANGIYKKVYGGLVVENITQALARIIVGEQALEIADELKSYKLKAKEVAQINMLTHDEVVSVIPERLADKVLKMKLQHMSHTRSWAAGLPVGAEGKYDLAYSK